jgi:prepilin-type N-terminal cleavage/methylation domain-containing protein
VRSAGYTLVEVLIAMSLMTLVLSGAWMVFHLGDRSRGVTASARALQTAMLVQEHFTNDLARLIAKGMPFRFDPQATGTIGFYVIDPQHTPATGQVGIRSVKYVHPPKLPNGAHQLLQRTYAGKTESIGASPLVSAAFLPYTSLTGPMIRVNLIVGRTQDDPDGPPLDHTFVARPSMSSAAMLLDLAKLSDFDPADRPSERGEKLPVPPGLFPPQTN